MKKTTNVVWGGRFKRKSSELLKKINNSIEFDHHLVNEDIKLSKSYAMSLLNAKIINSREFNKIQKGLAEIQEEIDGGKFKFSSDFLIIVF